MRKKEVRVLRFSHFSMATTFELLTPGGDEEYARQVSQAVFAEVDRLERLFNRFDPCSEIGQINLLKPGQSLMIGVETYECLKTALSIWSETRGAFDISFASLLTYKEEKDKALPVDKAGSLQSIELSRTWRGFRLKYSPRFKKEEGQGACIDLGGIGKGFALDRAAEIVSDWGLERALLHAGTSTALALGSPAHNSSEREGWMVGVGGKWKIKKMKKEFLLKDRALSGSGTEVKGSHIFDPRKGETASGHLAAWASHPSAAVSDALSTAFMAMSTEEVRAFCCEHPEVWAMVIIDPERFEVFE
ncbi:MAG: FAD:protein FMN transferase [Candidatus Aminicenantales bacterium]